jgi:sulfite exporter TauE/SafE
MEYVSALILGLGGSLHCGGMCGPLMMALLSGTDSASRVRSRVAYHAGRLLTYALIGLAFGLLGRGFHGAGWQRAVSVMAGVVLLVGGTVASRLSLDAWLVRSVGWVKALFRLGLGRKTLGSLVFLGMVNGFLPCGLVYAAGVSAATSGHAMAGALSMVVFGLGTLPLLLIVDGLGQRLGAASRARLQRAVPWVVSGVGVLLILRGLALGIPYLSPSSSGACPRCEAGS